MRGLRLGVQAWVLFKIVAGACCEQSFEVEQFGGVRR